MCNLFDLGIQEKVQKIICLKKDHMAFVLENSIMVFYLKSFSTARTFYIFNNQQNGDTNSPITETRFSHRHHSFYVRIQENEHQNLLCKFQTNFFEISEFDKQTVSLQISNFIEHPTQSDRIYAVSGETLLKFKLNEQKHTDEETQDLCLQTGLTRVETFHKMETFCKERETGGLFRVFTNEAPQAKDEAEENTFKENLLYKANGRISGIKLGKEAKKIYLQIENEIRAICSETQILLNVFEGHESNITSFIFSNNFQFMFT